MMKLNWGMIGILILNAIVWFAIFTYGFFTAIVWLVVFAAIVGLWLRLSGRA